MSGVTDFPASGPKKSSVHNAIVINGDTCESSSNANMGAAAIGVHASVKNNPSAAAFSSSKVRPPPPFLLKVYDMVQDPETDSIISWNNDGTSFIVKDPHRFSAEILSKYFRHNNLSSFVCQLNTYCFQKISWDRSEFQNEWFRRGKKRWLKNIKRRNQYQHQSGEASRKVGLDASELGKELENLRQLCDVQMEEIKELKEWHETAVAQISVLKKQAQSNESKLQKMVRFMAEAVWMLKKETHGPEVIKKRKLDGQETGSLMMLQDAGEESNKSHEGSLPTAQSDKQGMILTTESGTPNKENDKNTILGLTTIPDVCTSEFAVLEKQLMEDLNSDDVPKEEITKLQSSRIVIELEDLISGPADWMEYTKELLVKAKNLKPYP